MDPTNTEKYDIIIAGAGAAGLLLAYEIATRNELLHLKVLLIDPVKKEENDRTWCFWTKSNTPFDAILAKSWDKLEFLSEQFKGNYHLAPYKYKMLQSAAFYSLVWKKLDSCQNISFLKAKAGTPVNKNGGVEISAAGKVWNAKMLFDSRLELGNYNDIGNGYNLILQHFKGYVVEVPQDTFDTGTVRMFDFRIPQKGQVRFVYILPLTPKKALVEFTVFSPELLAEPTYDDVLKQYLEEILKLKHYKVLEEEKGVIPMTDFPFKRQLGKHIFKIGTQGGMCKPSTGYAFLNMWQDASSIAVQLGKGVPLKLRSSEKRFRLYDALLLDIIKKDGGSIAGIFSDMFQKNTIQRIFRFLNEETTPAEDLQVMWSVPSMPFFKAIMHLAKK